MRVSVAGAVSTFVFSAGSSVKTERAGSAFRIGAWLRSPEAGLTVCLRIEEVSKDDPLIAVRTSETCFAPTAKWEHIRILRKTIAAGHTLRFSAYSYGAESGDSFDIDGFTVMRKGAHGWKKVRSVFARSPLGG